jgi:hypothetical protein
MNKSAIHKLLVLLLIIILPVFILKRHKILRDRSTFMAAHRVDSIVEQSNKHFAIVIPILNASSQLEKNLQELTKQTYHNYHLLFVTQKAQAEIIAACQRVANESRSFFPSYAIHPSYYEAIHSLKNDTIVIHLELESSFSDPKALEKIAYTFSNSDIWLAYGSYMQVPSQELKLHHTKSISRMLQSHTYKQEWLASPVKIFYAGLFKEINNPLQGPMELKAFLLPMVKKAKKHIHYITDPLYYHDAKGPRKEEVLISY